MFRILIINYRDITSPCAGGAEVHVHEVFRRIAALGHHVEILCSGYPGSKKHETIDGIRITRKGRESYFNFSAQAHLIGLKADTYDLIIEDINKIPVYTPLFTRTRVMLIIPHLFGTTVFQEASIPVASYVFMWELLMKTLYRGLEIEVISNSTREDLVERGFDDDRIHVIYCGLDQELYKPDEQDRYEPGYPYIACLGRLKKYKRFDIALRGFRRLAGEYEDLQLLVIGDGDHASHLKRMSRDLGIGDRVIFTGHVAENEKVRILRGAKFVVNTSPKEGWGLTNVEAQACGVPVIASNSPGLRESVLDRETGLLVPHGDEEALAVSMRELLTDKMLHGQLCQGAARWAAGFSWDRCARETLELIEHVIKMSERDREN